MRKGNPIKNADLPPIPAKLYFTISEVSDLCGVKPHVLRYWEQEFTQLRNIKRRGNRRYYQHHEVLLVRHIRSLLHEEGFTISGARTRLGLRPRGRNEEVPPPAMERYALNSPPSADEVALPSIDLMESPGRARPNARSPLPSLPGPPPSLSAADDLANGFVWSSATAAASVLPERMHATRQESALLDSAPEQAADAGESPANLSGLAVDSIETIEVPESRDPSDPPLTSPPSPPLPTAVVPPPPPSPSPSTPDLIRLREQLESVRKLLAVPEALRQEAEKIAGEY